MSGKIKNATYSLPLELVEKYRELAQAGHIPSISAGVREAMATYVAKIELEILEKDMEAAARDPLFLADMEQVEADFALIDADVLGTPQ